MTKVSMLCAKITKMPTVAIESGGFYQGSSRQLYLFDTGICILDSLEFQEIMKIDDQEICFELSSVHVLDIQEVCFG